MAALYLVERYPRGVILLTKILILNNIMNSSSRPPDVVAGCRVLPDISLLHGVEQCSSMQGRLGNGFLQLTQRFFNGPAQGPAMGAQPAVGAQVERDLAVFDDVTDAEHMRTRADGAEGGDPGKARAVGCQHVLPGQGF